MNHESSNNIQGSLMKVYNHGAQGGVGENNLEMFFIDLIE